jgi:hypothetical protein
MRLLLAFYWIESALLIVDTTLYLKEGISLAGYGTDKLLFWTWCIITLIVIRNSVKRMWAKIYAGLLVASLILSMLPMLLPLIAVIQFALAQDRNCHYELNSRLRIQEVKPFGLAMPLVEVIENHGAWEKVIGSEHIRFVVNDESYTLCDVQSIRILPSDADRKIKIEFEFVYGKEILKFGQGLLDSELVPKVKTHFKMIQFERNPTRKNWLTKHD